MVRAKKRLCMVIALGCGAAANAGELTYTFALPSDDRWFYPFNFTPGFRAFGSCFGATGLTGFNDRDGTVIVGWDTSEQIEPGRPASSYDIQTVVVTLWNQASNTIVPAWPVDLTVDEWFTYPPGNGDADAGRPIELFGVGFGPRQVEADWLENSFYVGSGGDFDAARDPFPFVYQPKTGDLVHVEDSVKGLHNGDLAVPLCGTPDECPFTPQPWAIGEPQSYTPGSQTTPFPVRFEIDLGKSDGAVREYFQQQLRTGRVLVYVTSMHEAEFMGSASGFPSFFLREGVPLDRNAEAPMLQISLPLVPGDFSGDGRATIVDWTTGVGCLAGPGQPPAPQPPPSADTCLCVIDFDKDGDVDLLDAAEWIPRFVP